MEVVEQSTVPHPDESDTYYSKPPRHRRKQLMVIAVIIIIVLICIAGGAYLLFGHKKPSSTPTQTTDSTTVNQPADQATPTTTTDNTSGQYTSTGKDLNLSFTYPSSWNVSPASGDNASDQPITVTSPLVSLASAAGASVTGKIVVTIRPGSADITELAPGTATAALASVQIAYTKPTASQHQYPYITFLHLKGGENKDAEFEEVMITGINQFAKGQGITTYSLSQLDPIIAASFYQCANQACTDTSTTPLSITSSTWENDATCKAAASIFASLQLN
jgi:hypothetical protein